MRVLILVDHAQGISGPHRNVVGTLNALSRRSDVATTLLTGKIDESEPYARGTIRIRLGYRPKKLADVMSNLRLTFEAAKDADLIYVPSGLASCLFGSFVSRLLRKPLVAGPNVTHLPWRRADSPADLEVGWLSDLWLEASRRRRDFVRGHVRSALRHKVVNLHHAIDGSKFTPAKRDPGFGERFGVPDATVRILYVGQDYELKGVRQLLDAVDVLARRQDLPEMHVFFAGEMSDETVHRARDRASLHILGFQSGEDLCRLYASCDVSVVPSSWENFPFVVLEALASGLAVIGSRTGGIPEIIEDGLNGRLADLVGPHGKHAADAHERLASLIAELVGDRDQRLRLGKAGRATALEKFSESRLGDELVAYFRGVLA